MAKLSKVVKNMQRMGNIAVERKHLLKQRATRAEEMMKSFLTQYKIPFSFQRIIYCPQMFFIVDFCIHMKPRIFIEIDGESHIGKEDYDKEREKLIKKTRWWKCNFVRFTNEEVYNGKAFGKLKTIYKNKLKDYQK